MGFFLILNSTQQVCEKGRMRKRFWNSSMALGELWPWLPSPGATQPGGTPTARGEIEGNAVWKCSSSGAPRAVPLCLSEVVGVYLREEQLSQTSCF